MNAAVEDPSQANRISSNEGLEIEERCDGTAQRNGGAVESWRAALFPYQSRCAAAYDEDELCDEDDLDDDDELCDDVLASAGMSSAVWELLGFLAFASQVNPMARSRGVPSPAVGRVPPSKKAQTSKGKKSSGKAAAPPQQTAKDYSPEMWARIEREYMNSPKGQQQLIAKKYGLRGIQIRRHIASKVKTMGAKGKPPSVFDLVMNAMKNGGSRNKP